MTITKFDEEYTIRVRVDWVRYITEYKAWLHENIGEPRKSSWFFSAGNASDNGRMSCSVSFCSGSDAMLFKLRFDLL